MNKEEFEASTRRVSLPGSGLAQFMQMRGRRVNEACGVLWHSVERGLFVSLPHQLRFDPDPHDLRRFLWSGAVTGVRYPSLISNGLECGLYQYTSKQYGIPQLHRNFRAKVRKGLDDCQVVRLDESDLLKQGLELNLHTMKRQDRWDPEFGAERSWKRLVTAIRHCPAIAAYGALVDGHLAAYAITCREDGWLHILHRMSRDEDLEHCPNHVLDFTITSEIAQDPKLKAVSMGYASLVAGTDGLHEYKLRLGYTFSPHHSVVRLHPAIAAILTSAPAKSVLAAMRSHDPRNQQLQKVGAVIHAAELASEPVAHHEPDHDRAVSA
ncbi:MAG: hypothetical protein LAO79_15335 [Acidobacteriia bacterium]|nr:hypothetical protein [Terriglobia bacterium]